MTFNIESLNQLAEFFVTYGPWAVAIVEGFYILKLNRDGKKEKEKINEERIRERESLLKRHEEYHNEVVGLVKDSTNSKAIIAGRLLTITNETKTLRKGLEQYTSLITEGVVEFTPAAIEEDVEDILKDLAGQPSIRFRKILRAEDLTGDLTEDTTE